MNRTVAILEKALDTLHVYGWVQGNSGDYAEGFCSSAAISVATAELKLNDHRYVDWNFADNAARRQLVKASEMRSDASIASWNDNPCRTFEEIEQAFKEAINQELAEGENLT